MKFNTNFLILTFNLNFDLFKTQRLIPKSSNQWSFLKARKKSSLKLFKTPNDKWKPSQKASNSGQPRTNSRCKTNSKTLKILWNSSVTTEPNSWLMKPKIFPTSFSPKWARLHNFQKICTKKCFPTKIILGFSRISEKIKS